MRRIRPVPLIVVGLLILISCAASAQQQSLIVNAAFHWNAGDPMPEGWDPLWEHAPGSAKVSIADTTAPDGGVPLTVTNSGKLDWACSQSQAIPVHAGEVYVFHAWMKCETVDYSQLSLQTTNTSQAPVDWDAKAVTIEGTRKWCYLSSWYLVPAGIATIRFRFSAGGKGSVTIASPELIRKVDLGAVATQWGDRRYTLSNDLIDTAFIPANGTFEITDKRNGKIYRQSDPGDGDFITNVDQTSDHSLRITVDAPVLSSPVIVDIDVPADAPQVRFVMKSSCDLWDSFTFPRPFHYDRGVSLVVPLNEGILYPVDDPDIAIRRFLAYRGCDGLSMPFTGSMDEDGAGILELYRTCNDATADLRRQDGHLYFVPMWDAQKGKFGYDRKLTYALFDHGGYVAQAKFYREYAKQVGLFVTLAEKRKANPHVDQLIGAADVWSQMWTNDIPRVDLCREMKSLGIDRVLWNGSGTANEIKGINQLGYLTGRYDGFGGLYPPNDPGDVFKDGKIPDDIVIDKDGNLKKAWLDLEPTGNWQSYTMNPFRSIPVLRRDVSAELKTKPYTARFIDGLSSGDYGEDYSPDHPMTRTQDREARATQLSICSKELKLVTGSETGIDAFVPCVDYFEGMMSLALYRVQNYGYNPQMIVDPNPETIKFQVGTGYRIPLWELVYHDCTVSYWYWCDYNNKMPAVWDRRDLFNILYATPPVFMFDKPIFGRPISTIWREHA